jgi:hypothetical protein
MVMSSPSNTCMKRKREKLHLFDFEQYMKTTSCCIDLNISRKASNDEANGKSIIRKTLCLSKE